MNEVDAKNIILKSVSRETFEKLDIYKKLLEKWQKSINIVSRGTLESFWKRHILDSFQIKKYIEKENAKTVLDIGSGGGFPGMVLAICSDFEVTCVDSDTKKMLFLEEVARLTSTKVTILAERIETPKFADKKYDIICARGFSALKNLILFTKKCAPIGIFLKGKKLQQEISEAKRYFNFQYNIYKSETDVSGNIIVVKNIIDK